MGVVNFPEAGVIGASLLPKRYDINVYQGDTFRFVLRLGYQGQPTDLTGWTGRCHVKDTQGTIQSEATVDITNESTGEITVDFGDTGQIGAGEHKYDLELTDAGGNRRTYIGGKFIVTEDITE